MRVTKVLTGGGGGEDEAGMQCGTCCALHKCPGQKGRLAVKSKEAAAAHGGLGSGIFLICPFKDSPFSDMHRVAVITSRGLKNNE